MSERKKIGKIIAIAVAAVLVIMLVASAVWIFILSRPAEADTEQNAKVGPIYETEEFTVNLSESLNHYIKARFALEMENEKVHEELQEKLHLLQDTIIMVLSGQKLEIMSTVQGKESLKSILIKEINRFLDKGKVIKIYYKTFIFS